MEDVNIRRRNSSINKFSMEDFDKSDIFILDGSLSNKNNIKIFLYEFIKIIISYLLWLILISMGWHFISDDEVKRAKKHKKSVFIFSHTSYWDFWLVTIYRFAFPYILNNIYTVVRPQFFESWYTKYIKNWNLIPATRAEEKNKGFVDSTVKIFESKENAYLMISPEGRMKKTDWKSGYYYISKELNIPIIVVGFDYELKKLVVMDFRFHDDYKTKEKMEEILMKDMGNIVPKNLSQSKVQITKNFNEIDVSAYDPIMVSNVIMAMLAFWYISYYDNWLLIHAILTSSISLIHHYNVENNEQWGKYDFWGNIIFIIHEFIFLLYNNMLTMDLFWFIIIIIAIHSYQIGSGRQYKNNGKRSFKFTINLIH